MLVYGIIYQTSYVTQNIGLKSNKLCKNRLQTALNQSCSDALWLPTAELPIHYSGNLFPTKKGYQ
jgi:hypothetical protein